MIEAVRKTLVVDDPINKSVKEKTISKITNII